MSACEEGRHGRSEAGDGQGTASLCMGVARRGGRGGEFRVPNNIRSKLYDEVANNAKHRELRARKTGDLYLTRRHKRTPLL